MINVIYFSPISINAHLRMINEEYSKKHMERQRVTHVGTQAS